MKKTLIITLEYPPHVGGIASFVYNMAAHLPANDLVVWAPQLEGDKEYDLKNGWKTFRGVSYYKIFWPRWLKLYWQIRRIVKSEKIQQIYVNHALPVGYIARMIQRSFKIPFTVFFHGTDLEIGLKSKTQQLKMVCKYAEKIVVNSNFLAEKLLNNCPSLNKDRITILNPGPADFFFTREPDEKIKKMKAELALEGKKVLLSVSRLEDGKGYPHLLHLLPEILKKIPNAVLIIVGDGPKKKTILDQIQKDNLQNCVRFVGNIPYNNLPSYYQVADLFVLLTHKDENHEEGWGTVFLEAAASGLPVVAGRAGGVEEVVKNQKTGLVVDVNQEQNIVMAITSLLSETERAKEMGRFGMQRVQNEFMWNKQLTKISSL